MRATAPASPDDAIRRGLLVGVPIAVALVLEFSLGWSSRGAIATAAFVCGFTALDAPAGPRVLWQVGTAPLVGVAAAIGVLSSQWAPAAVVAMGLVALVTGFWVADTERLAWSGISVALGLMIPQGLSLPADDALLALAYGTAGGAIQASWALLVWLAFDRAEREDSGWDWTRTRARFRAALTLDSPAARHALRFGGCLALGVAIYRIVGWSEHGYWIPLTALFILRPERAETEERLVLRAAGTILGLAVATGLALLFDGSEPWIVLTLSISAILAFGLITVQYGLFTAAITIFIVLLSDTLGEAPLDAAWQRVLGTAIGIALVWLAFRVLPAPGEGGRRGRTHGAEVAASARNG